jgi:hypothetical protein
LRTRAGEFAKTVHLEKMQCDFGFPGARL